MIVELENVSISYPSGNYQNIGFKDYIIQKAKGHKAIKDVLAVDSVNFSIDKGDFLGIVGTNGSGKSTLLKAISDIIRPDHGKVTVKGNIAALLELGTGFDSELTVKENTFLRGALMGYTRKFMHDAYAGILQFSELEEFENKPFRHLSSGMKARLAFAIACLVQPDILILDEVLSVGDGAFRQKSEDKMQEIIKNGATTLFVSHSIYTMRKMCNKVLWLDKGVQKAFGEANEVIDAYEAFLWRQPGWRKRDNIWYYFNYDGTMATGNAVINGVMHKFNDDGIWIGKEESS